MGIFQKRVPVFQPIKNNQGRIQNREENGREKEGVIVFSGFGFSETNLTGISEKCKAGEKNYDKMRETTWGIFRRKFRARIEVAKAAGRIDFFLAANLKGGGSVGKLYFFLQLFHKPASKKFPPQYLM